jgi:hypothetical protein
VTGAFHRGHLNRVADRHCSPNGGGRPPRSTTCPSAAPGSSPASQRPPPSTWTLAPGLWAVTSSTVVPALTVAAQALRRRDSAAGDPSPGSQPSSSPSAGDEGTRVGDVPGRGDEYGGHRVLVTATHRPRRSGTSQGNKSSRMSTGIGQVRLGASWVLATGTAFTFISAGDSSAHPARPHSGQEVHRDDLASPTSSSSTSTLRPLTGFTSFSDFAIGITAPGRGLRRTRSPSPAPSATASSTDVGQRRDLGRCRRHGQWGRGNGRSAWGR